ncbi:MAG TPA: hypothetical protein VMF67_12325 [Rhizomicrobium sp.]|nr:hypothetical protein [Rhizomicrobium sp.]
MKFVKTLGARWISFSNTAPRDVAAIATIFGVLGMSAAIIYVAARAIAPTW